MRRGAFFVVATSVVALACGTLLSSEPDDVVPPPRSDADASPDACAGDCATDGGADVVVDAAPDATVVVCASPTFRETDGGCHPVVFLSSIAYTATMNDIDAAPGAQRGDRACALLAEGKFPGSAFKAWMSSQGAPVNERFEKTPRPYRLVDGTIVANDWNDLVSGQIRAPINHTEDGVVIVATDILVWTGTDENGNELASCFDWKDTNGVGTIGEGTKTDGGWTKSREILCTNTARIYCVEQVK